MQVEARNSHVQNIVDSPEHDTRVHDTWDVVAAWDPLEALGANIAHFLTNAKKQTHIDWDATAAWDLGKAKRDALSYLLDASPYWLRALVGCTCGRSGKAKKATRRWRLSAVRDRERERERESLRRCHVDAKGEARGTWAHDLDKPRGCRNVGMRRLVMT
jgi:hypothetical protein